MKMIFLPKGRLHLCENPLCEEPYRCKIGDLELECASCARRGTSQCTYPLWCLAVQRSDGRITADRSGFCPKHAGRQLVQLG